MGQRVMYQDLKDWIAEQEAYEAAHSRPAPLTPAQLKAISLLKLPVKRPEPELGRADWVSLLHRYRDAHPSVSVGFHDHPDCDDVANKQMCICKFSDASIISSCSSPLEFPGREGGGLVLPATTTTNGNGNDSLAPPVFARKKDAKKYAAKCCVEWLIAGGRMPADLVNVVFPKGNAKRIASPPVVVGAGAKAEEEQEEGEEEKSILSTLNGGSGGAAPGNQENHPPAVAAAPPPPPVLHGDCKNGFGLGDSDDADGATLPATQRVPELCRRLGMPPPQYKLASASAADNDLWTGWVDFGAVYGPQVPEHVGRVREVRGRKKAKEAMAAQVARYLERVVRERYEQFEAMMARVDD